MHFDQKEKYSESLLIPVRQWWYSHKIVKPFLSDKGSHGNENCTLLENGKLIEDQGKFQRFFNDHYINVMENITGRKQEGFHSGSLSNRNQTKHILLRLIEQWRACLYQNKAVGGTITGFDCLPHDLLIAKLEAYGVEKSSLLLIMSYLKDQKHAVKIKGILSLFQLIESGVRQGSILGPMLFNIFANDLFFLLDKDLHNFADDNTVSAVS